MLTIRRVLHPTDHSACAEGAFAHAARIADRYDAELHVLHVTDPPAGMLEGCFDDLRITADDVETELAAMLPTGGPPMGASPTGRSPTDRDRQTSEHPAFTEVEVPGPDAATGILRYATGHEIDLIVMGTHGRHGIRYLLMGSVAAEVVRSAPCPVLTVPSAAARSTPGPYAPILVPVDFSDANREALAAAHLFAARFDAPVELLHVADEPVTYADAYANAHADAHASAPGLASGHEVRTGTRNNPVPRLRRFDRDAGTAPASRYHLREGRPEYEIAAVARRIGAGLIVMATHGRTGWARVRLGSVTEQTLRRARCPVLSLRPEAMRSGVAPAARSSKTTLTPEARGYGAG